MKEPFEVESGAENASATAAFDAGNPFVGGAFVPIIGERASEDLNPELFPEVGVKLGEGASDAGERVDLESVKSFDGEGRIFGEGEFAGVDDGVFVAVVDVIFVHFVDLDGGVLGVNLAFDEGLEDFGDPDVKADLTLGGDDFEAEVFLDAAGALEFVFVAQDAVERGEKLFGGEFFFVVGARDFQHE